MNEHGEGNMNKPELPPGLCPACQHPKHTGSDCQHYAPITGIVCICTAADSRKASRGKVKGFTLLPWDTIAEEAEVYAYGAKKYAPNSWREVDDALDEYTNAMFRHLRSYFKGEERDPESGLRHLAHARWNLGAMMELTRKP
jgi:hypothetical protein